MAATNNPELIDGAALRGGRFAEKIFMGRLTGEDLVSFLEQDFASRNKVSFAADLTPTALAAKLAEAVPSDALGLLRRAVNYTFAQERGDRPVCMADIDKAIESTQLWRTTVFQKPVLKPKRKIMFQVLMRANRYGAIAAAGSFLLSFLLPAVQAGLGLNTLEGLQIYATILAGLVLLDKPLAKLSFNEVCREVAGVDIDEATEKFWQEEQRRRREEANETNRR